MPTVPSSCRTPSAAELRDVPHARFLSLASNPDLDCVPITAERRAGPRPPRCCRLPPAACALVAADKARSLCSSPLFSLSRGLAAAADRAFIPPTGLTTYFGPDRLCPCGAGKLATSVAFYAWHGRTHGALAKSDRYPSCAMCLGGRSWQAPRAQTAARAWHVGSALTSRARAARPAPSVPPIPVCGWGLCGKLGAGSGSGVDRASGSGGCG